MSGMDGYNHWGEALTGINQYYTTTISSASSSPYYGYSIQQPSYQYVVQDEPQNPWITIQQTPMWQHGWSDEDIKNKSKEAAQIADGWDPDENS